jgi:hypothetical protein
VTSKRILGSHASVGAIPYYNGSPSFSATGAGSAYQVLSLDPTGKIPGWSSLEGAKLVYASSGSVDAVITNLPTHYNDIVIRAYGLSTAPTFDTWTYRSANGTTGTLGTTLYQAYFGIDQDSTFSTTTIAGAANNLSSISLVSLWSTSATYGGAVEFKILDYANASGIASADKPLIGMTHNAPGTSTIQGFKVWNGRVALPNSTDVITGFTVNVAAATQVYVYVTR